MNFLETEQFRAALGELLASETFARSPALGRLLKYLVERVLAGEAASLKESVIGHELYERPASYDPKLDSVVRVSANRLRVRLEEHYRKHPDERLRIVLPKGSYVPLLEVREEALPSPDASELPVEIANDPIPEVAAFQSVVPQQAESRKVPMVWMTILAVFIAGSLALGARALRNASDRTKPSRVAVVAFRDLAQKPETSWVSAALRELLSTDLSRGKLQVIPIATVESAEKQVGLSATERPTPETLKKLCEAMQCDELVAGSYLIDGTSIRLDTHLIDGHTGEALGNFNSTAPANNLLALIENTNRAMRGQMEVHLSEAETAELAASVPKNPQAHRLYIEGMQRLRAIDPVMASELLEQSTTLEPDFALAHTELSHALLFMGQEDHAIVESHKAQALAGHLSKIDRLRVNALAEAAEHKYEDSIATYGELFALVPQDLEYARVQASAMENAGLNRKAIELLEKVVKEHPKTVIDPAIYLTIGQGYDNLGENQPSLYWARRAEDEAKRRGDLVLYERALTAESYALDGMGSSQEAFHKANEAVALATKFNDKTGALQALVETAETENRLGKLKEARVILLQVVQEAETLGQTQKEIYALGALGRNYTRSGDMRQALSYYQKGLKVAQLFNQPTLLRGAEFDVANAQQRLGQKTKAKAGFKHLLDEATASGDEGATARAKQALMELASVGG